MPASKPPGVDPVSAAPLSSSPSPSTSYAPPERATHPEERRSDEPRRRHSRREEDRARHIRQLTADLLKYPVLVFSILFALYGAKKLLGVEFGFVTRISTSGIEFRADSVSDRVTQLETQLRDAAFSIDVLKKQMASRGDSATLQKVALQAEQRSFEALQQDTSISASSLKSAATNRPFVAGRVGYIWVGNVDAQHHWVSPKIGGIADPGKITPLGQIKSGDEFVVNGNMVMRDGAPDSASTYFSGRRSLGVVPRGTRIIAIDPPLIYDRGYANQCWMKIQVPQ